MMFTISCSCCGSCSELSCLWRRFSEEVSQLFGDDFFALFGTLVTTVASSSLPLLLPSLLESDSLDSLLLEFLFFFSFTFPSVFFFFLGADSSRLLPERFSFDARGVGFGAAVLVMLAALGMELFDGGGAGAGRGVFGLSLSGTGGPLLTTPPAFSSFCRNSSLGFWNVRHSLLIWLIGGSFKFGSNRS